MAYRLLFEKLFGKKAKKVMILHKLATLSYGDLIEIMSDFNFYSFPAPHLEDIGKLVMLFLKQDLNLDDEAILWLKSLIRVSNWDTGGLDFICDAYGIYDDKLKIMKGLVTKEILQMESLLRALSEVIPIKFSKSIIQVFKGDLNALQTITKMQAISVTEKITFDYITDDTLRACKIVNPEGLDLTSLLQKIFKVI